MVNLRKTRQQIETDLLDDTQGQPIKNWLCVFFLAFLSWQTCQDPN